MTLSILIVNWNSKDYLRRCLQSVRSTCAELNPQVVVVDGGSFDGCAEMLETEFPQVVFVQSPENLGFGRCNNLGFEKVTGEVLLLLNPDCELKPGAVQTLLQALEALPDAGILGPRLLNTDGSLQTSCVRALPTPLNRALDSDFLRKLLPKSRLWGTAAAFQAMEPIEVEAVSGACMLLQSKIFSSVGGFSHEFFIYGEDMDICAKVRRAQLKVYHVPQAVVTHHGGGSSSRHGSQFSTVMLRVAGEIYMRRNHGSGVALCHRLLQITSAVARLAVLMPALLFSWGPRRNNARQSAWKWWHVLAWGIGLSPIRVQATLPVSICPPSEGNGYLSASDRVTVSEHHPCL